MARELWKGNEAFAESAIRAGLQAYFGYPITVGHTLRGLSSPANPILLKPVPLSITTALLAMASSGVGAGVAIFCFHLLR